RGSKLLPARVATVLEGAHISDSLVPEQFPECCERSLGVFRAAIHHPCSHLIDGAVGERTNYCHIAYGAGKRQNAAFILQQHDAFGCKPGRYVESFRGHLRRSRGTRSLVE